MDKKCDRCGKEMAAWTMSFFNTEECCLSCIEKEQKHPDFPKAKEAEREAIKAGDMNFPGIGLPEGLRRT